MALWSVSACAKILRTGFECSNDWDGVLIVILKLPELMFYSFNVTSLKGKVKVKLTKEDHD